MSSYVLDKPHCMSEGCNEKLVHVLHKRFGLSLDTSTHDMMLVFGKLVPTHGYKRVIDAFRDAGYSIPARMVVVKIAITGDSGVGKTSLCSRFCEDMYREDVKSTIGVAFGLRHVVVEDYLVKAVIWDHAGQKRFAVVREGFYKGTMATLIVFDVANRESFSNIPAWIEEVRRAEPTCAVILVGNKADLEREVSYKEGREMSISMKCCEYFETSAKTGAGVNEAFTYAARIALEASLSRGAPVVNLS